MSITWRIAVVLILAYSNLPNVSIAQDVTPMAPPSPPAQPATGPGGNDYAFELVIAEHFGPAPDGTADPTGYWIFEPAEPNAAATSAALPLILFFHGYYGTDPLNYRAWIDHIVRRGAVVVYPDYQPIEDALKLVCPSVCDESELPTLPHALAAIRAALDELSAGNHIAVDLTKVGATGHSWGGMLSAKYAAIAEAEGLPAVGAIMPAMPACACDFAQGLESIPSTTRVIMLVGREDFQAGEQFSRMMWQSMTGVPMDQRDYVRILSDRHGTPALLADHGLPSTNPAWGGPLDAYDWYGTWKFFDLLTDCAFLEIRCSAALGATPEQRFMGTWSDGVPVIEAEVTKDPTRL